MLYFPALLMLDCPSVDPAQCKRLADICEKLGVALFVAAGVQAILAGTPNISSALLVRVIVAIFGLGLLIVSVQLSKP